MAKFKQEYKQKRYDAGLCVGCGKPRDDERILCESCRTRQAKTFRQRTQKRLDEGRCRVCGEPQAKGSNLYCLEHWFRKITIDRMGSNAYWEDVAELFKKQNRKCAYTGRDLVLGLNAQLDHKDPVELGGSNTPDNVHWVDADINRMKGKRTHAEFLSVCRIIVEHNE